MRRFDACGRPIRRSANFVGLAENAWDFTDPDAMPGFGPLESTDEVRRMIAQVVDRVGELAKEGASETAPIETASLNDSNVIEDNNREAWRCAGARLDAAKVLPKPWAIKYCCIATKKMLQCKTTLTEASEKPKQLARRSHGGALPE